MFAHERHPEGFTQLGAVAVVIALWALGASLLLKVYLQGGVPLCGG